MFSVMRDEIFKGLLVPRHLRRHLRMCNTPAGRSLEATAEAERCVREEIRLELDRPFIAKLKAHALRHEGDLLDSFPNPHGIALEGRGIAFKQEVLRNAAALRDTGLRGMEIVERAISGALGERIEAHIRNTVADCVSKGARANDPALPAFSKTLLSVDRTVVARELCRGDRRRKEPIGNYDADLRGLP
jgi:hypothetical protein